MNNARRPLRLITPDIYTTYEESIGFPASHMFRVLAPNATGELEQGRA